MMMMDTTGIYPPLSPDLSPAFSLLVVRVVLRFLRLTVVEANQRVVLC